jgi:hypothetical protein
LKGYDPVSPGSSPRIYTPTETLTFLPMTFVCALFRADYNCSYLRVPRMSLIGQGRCSVIDLVLL